MDLLSHPFRLTPTGQVATVVDGSADADAEGLAALVLTRRGERPLAPDYGLTDPAYGDIDLGEVNAQLNRFGPPIHVLTIEATPVDDAHTRTVITYEEVEPQA